MAVTESCWPGIRRSRACPAYRAAQNGAVPAMNHLSPKDITSLLGATVQNWHNDKAPRLGAALSYYVILSLAPAVVIVLAVSGWAFGAKAAQGRLVWQIQKL